jgi:hypothetical protein
MWTLFVALFLVAAPAASQSVTVDFTALDGVRRAPRGRMQIQIALAPIGSVDAPMRLDMLPTLQRALHPRDASAPQAEAVLALPVREPPRPVQARAGSVELRRFAPAALLRVAPRASVQIDLRTSPELEAARLLRVFAPSMPDPAPLLRLPVLRQAAPPVLGPSVLRAPLAALTVDLPKLQPRRDAQLHFAAESDALTDADRQALDGLAALLRRQRGRHLRLTLALPTGDDPDLARQLAWGRMVAVRRHLTGRGIAGAQIEARATVAQQAVETARIGLVDEPEPSSRRATGFLQVPSPWR